MMAMPLRLRDNRCIRPGRSGAEGRGAGAFRKGPSTSVVLGPELTILELSGPVLSGSSGISSFLSGAVLAIRAAQRPGNRVVG